MGPCLSLGITLVSRLSSKVFHALPLAPLPFHVQVREIIRTNLGAMMISLLRPIHRFKLWVLR